MANQSQEGNFSNVAFQAMEQKINLNQSQRPQNLSNQQLPQNNQSYVGGRQRDNRGLVQYLNHMNHLNGYNQNMLYQQQNQLEVQNQQMNQLLQEQNDLQRQLNIQRQLANQARQKPPPPSSRQKEMDALALLNNFQRSLGNEKSLDPLSIFDGNNGNLASKKERRPTKLSSYNEFNPPSRGNYDKPSSRDYYQGYNPQPQNNYYDQHPGYPYGQGNVHASPFQSAANLLMNPISPAGYHPNGNMFQPMYQQQPMQGIDPYTGLPIAYPQETKKVDSNSKTAEILMSSLEKQNQILAELTGSINKDRDYKVIQEAKEIENKIRQLEFESQAKQHQLFSQNTFDALSQNYNRPIPNPDLQKYNTLLPGMSPNMISPSQLSQLQFLMGGQNRFFPGGLPQFSVLPSEYMQQQMKMKKLKEDQKKKEKKKKNKLKELLLLLGLDEDDEEEEELDKARGSEDNKPKDKKDKAKKKEQQAVDKALAEERAKQEEEQRKKDAEESKKKRKRQIMALMWTRLYPILYYVDFYEAKGLTREAVYQAFSDRIGANMESAKSWATKAAAKGFDLVLNNPKQVLAIVPFGGKKLNAKDLDSRPGEINKILKVLLDGLVNNTKEEIIPSSLLGFLGDISNDYSFPPQNFLFAFEINRLNFTHTAALKDTTPPKVQMVCAFFMLIRVFIGEMLLQPNKVQPTATVTDNLMRNVKTLASILVIIIIEYLRSRVLVQNNNQNHLDVEIKIKPRSSPIPFNSPMDLKDEAPDAEGEEKGTTKKKDETEIVISGLYTKEQLSAFFSKKTLVDEIKALVEGWCNAIAPIVTSYYNEQRKAKAKK